MGKEEKIKRAQEKAKRESEVFHCMTDIQKFKKAYSDDIFWSAINRLHEKRSTEKKAKKEIASAEQTLKNLKQKYGDI